MAKDLAVDENNDFMIDPDTGDLVMTDDDSQTEAYRVALGTNEGELAWNPSFGLNHLSLLGDIDDESSMEDEISDYLESQFDNFISADVTGIERSGRVATVSLKIVSTDDDGEEQVTNTEMGVETDGTE